MLVVACHLCQYLEMRQDTPFEHNLNPFVYTIDVLVTIIMPALRGVMESVMESVTGLFSLCSSLILLCLRSMTLQISAPVRCVGPCI